MDWDALIEVLTESVRDDFTRGEIYRKLFDLVGTRDASDSEGQDDVFDNTLSKYVWDEDEEDIYHEEDDGFDYGEDE